MAGLLAAVTLLPWLIRRPAGARLRVLAAGAVVALVVASPQLIAMIQQAVAGGASVSAHVLAHTGKSYGVGLYDLFAPSQRVANFGMMQTVGGQRIQHQRQVVGFHAVVRQTLHLAGEGFLIAG